MSDEAFTATSPGFYTILVQGALDPEWGSRLANMQVLNEPVGVVRLTGHMADQAALQGVLEQLYAFGLPILSVTRLVEECGHVLDSPRSNCP